MEMGNTGEMEGKLRIICAQFPFHQKINKPLPGWSNFRCVFRQTCTRQIVALLNKKSPIPRHYTLCNLRQTLQKPVL